MNLCAGIQSVWACRIKLGYTHSPMLDKVLWPALFYNLNDFIQKLHFYLHFLFSLYIII